MKFREESKQPAWICVLDAKSRNERYSKLFSDDQKDFGDLLYQAVSNAYIRSRIFKNYRKQFLAVKVEAPKFEDRISKEVEQLDTFCISNNIQIHKTNTSIVYRIPL